MIDQSMIFTQLIYQTKITYLLAKSYLSNLITQKERREVYVREVHVMKSQLYQNIAHDSPLSFLLNSIEVSLLISISFTWRKKKPFFECKEMRVMEMGFVGNGCLRKEGKREESLDGFRSHSCMLQQGKDPFLFPL